MLHYILQTILFQLLFLLMYEFLLKKETFFTYNRWYLLLTPVLSLLLPLLKFHTLEEMVPVETLVFLPEVTLGESASGATTEPGSGVIAQEAAHRVNWWWIAYGAGASLSLVLFIKKYRILKSLFRHKTISRHKNLRIIQVPNSNLACTFFNTIFLGDRLKQEELQQILSHEEVHVKQIHSADLLFFELLKIIFWFNPLVYIYQVRISTLHEFIADAGVVEKVEKKTYYQQLLNTAFSTQNISFINQFFNHSLIKKRIVMLQKSRSKTLSKLKYLFLVPLMLVMLTYVACSEDAEIMPQETTTVDQEDEIMKEAFREELLLMQEDGAKFMEIYDAFMIETDAHIKSKEAFYRSQVYMEYIIEKMVEREMESGTFDPEKHERMKSSLNKSYEEYVADQKNKEPKTTTRTEVDRSGGDVPFAVIDEVPVFPGCEALASNDERKTCLSEGITAHVNQNFDTEAVKPFAIPGEVNRIYVQFRIEKNGSVKILGARASHPELSREAERVVGLLPQMTPGKQRGEEVGVLYSLPISFRINE